VPQESRRIQPPANDTIFRFLDRYSRADAACGGSRGACRVRRAGFGTQSRGGGFCAGAERKVGKRENVGRQKSGRVFACVLKHARRIQRYRRRKKDRRPFLALVTAGGGGDGGPGSRVERDGERCYRGAPVLAGGEAVAGSAIGCLLHVTQALSRWFAIERD
jgi:hypothetical protein